MYVCMVDMILSIWANTHATIILHISYYACMHACSVNEIFKFAVCIGQDNFKQLSDSSMCTCPDNTWSVTYECTVMGNVGNRTVWR